MAQLLGSPTAHLSFGNIDHLLGTNGNARKPRPASRRSSILTGGSVDAKGTWEEWPDLCAFAEMEYAGTLTHTLTSGANATLASHSYLSRDKNHLVAPF